MSMRIGANSADAIVSHNTLPNSRNTPPNPAVRQIGAREAVVASEHDDHLFAGVIDEVGGVPWGRGGEA